MPAQQKVQMYGIRHCYIEVNNGGALAFHRVWFTKKCDLKVTTAKIEYSGDGQKFHKNYGYFLEGSIEAAIDDTTLDAILWATPQVTPTGLDDFSVRQIKGSQAENQQNFVGLRLSIDAEDADTGAPMVVRYRVLKVQFDPDTPDVAQTQTAVGRMLNWSARPAKTDIIGTALTGVPTNGAYWVKDYLTNSANFDPVAGDVL